MGALGYDIGSNWIIFSPGLPVFYKFQYQKMFCNEGLNFFYDELFEWIDFV
jgi:hypothetical protein